MNLKNKVIAVTGGAQGLGLEVVKGFVELGANVAILDVNEACLQEAAIAFGDAVKTYLVDVTSEPEVEACFTDIAQTFGALNGLVNNAGLIRDAAFVKAKEGVVTSKMSFANWQEVINVNLTGVFLCGREAATQMINTNSEGVIVNVSSCARNGNYGQTNYAATKAGVVAMSNTWAKELSKYNIRCASIAPGFIHTPLVESMNQEVLGKLTQNIPLKRVASAAEIASGIQFIFENDYFTGRVLDLDGGLRL